MGMRRLDGYREPDQITDRSLIMFLEEYGTDGLLKHARDMCKRIYGLVLERDYQRDRATRLAERLKKYEPPESSKPVARSYRSGPECDG